MTGSGENLCEATSTLAFLHTLQESSQLQGRRWLPKAWAEHTGGRALVSCTALRSSSPGRARPELQEAGQETVNTSITALGSRDDVWLGVRGPRSTPYYLEPNPLVP